mmetsp:Transcript_8019/g.24153  ORF Transcript_8019/g.24153 Transcript_8019/m.24153 type:complete len:543 (+) Transcript_8019:369-1997(+)
MSLPPLRLFAEGEPAGLQGRLVEVDTIPVEENSAAVLQPQLQLPRLRATLGRDASTSHSTVLLRRSIHADNVGIQCRTEHGLVYQQRVPVDVVLWVKADVAEGLAEQFAPAGHRAHGSPRNTVCFTELLLALGLSVPLEQPCQCEEVGFAPVERALHLAVWERHALGHGSSNTEGGVGASEQRAVDQKLANPHVGGQNSQMCAKSSQPHCGLELRHLALCVGACPLCHGSQRNEVVQCCTDGVALGWIQGKRQNLARIPIERRKHRQASAIERRTTEFGFICIPQLDESTPFDEPVADAGTDAAGTSRALFCTGFRDELLLKHGSPVQGVETGNLGPHRVDHIHDILDSDGSFGDVGGAHDLAHALWGPVEGASLVLRRQQGMQRHGKQGASPSGQPGDQCIDIGNARNKDQYGSVGLLGAAVDGFHKMFYQIKVHLGLVQKAKCSLVGRLPWRRWRLVLLRPSSVHVSRLEHVAGELESILEEVFFYRKRPSLNRHGWDRAERTTRRIGKVLHKFLRVQSGGHEHYSQIPAKLQHLSEQKQ